MPCPHAFTVVLYDYGNPNNYVDEYYTIEMYKKEYAPITYPMPSEEQWIKKLAMIIWNHLNYE
jgi:hypothetical protein